MMSAALTVLAFAAACTGAGIPSRTYTHEDLALIVLQRDDAPVGTTYVTGDSGYVGVERIAEDQQEADDLVEAGFIEAFIAIFFDPTLFEPEDRLDPEGSIALSYAIRFGDAQQAADGFRIIEADVRADSTDLDDRSAAGFGGDAFAVYGELDPNEPPGFLYVWRVGNVVQVLVAAGARDAIREEAARTLAERMLAYARDPAAQSPSPSPTTTASPTTTPSST